MIKTRQLFLHDKRLKVLVAGCDEAGRGSLAGVLVCAACIMPLEKKHIISPRIVNDIIEMHAKQEAYTPKRLNSSKLDLTKFTLGFPLVDGINDSKKISEKNREELFEIITKIAVAYSVSVIDPSTIDSINILKATKKGMNECINGLKTTPDLVLVDAVSGLDILPSYQSIIKGDEISYNIASASIIAKVTRDRIMKELDSVYPNYGFKQNKGYGTRQHIEAIRKYGTTPIHRKLFVRNALCEQLSFDI